MFQVSVIVGILSGRAHVGELSGKPAKYYLRSGPDVGHDSQNSEY